MRTAGRPLPIYKSKILSFLLSLLIYLFSGLYISVAQNPPSRPILFAHGFCSSAFDWEPLYTPLYQQLPQDLYLDSTVYYVSYNAIHNTIAFSILQDGNLVPVDESTIPSSARFFNIMFYDPVSRGTLDVNVARISILNKAYELSQVIRHITSITHIKDVIVVAHSMGGLDARTYVENMASKGTCYDYENNQPDYSLQSCRPGSGNAAFAGDVGDIVAVDTPHTGDLLAELSLPFGSCFADASVNRTELNFRSLGGAGLVEALNYDGSTIAGVAPSDNPAPIQAVQDYFSDVTDPWDNYGGWLSGYSDDVVLLQWQSILLNLPSSNTNATLQDVPISYLSSDSGIAGTSACWFLGKPVLHLIPCLGAQPNTQNAIASQVNAYVNGTLTSITVNATNNGDPWTGPASFQISGPDGAQNEYSVPLTTSDVVLGTYSVSYLSGGPPANGPPTIIATPNPTIKSGQWAITFTMQFSSQNSAVTTSPATSITSSSGVLNGSVNPNSASGSVYFYWGTDPTMSTYSTYYAGGVVPNNQTQPFSAQLVGLATATTYYFETVFYDSSNGSYQYGAVLSFTTLTTATVTKAATAITSSAGTLHGTVNPNSSSGSVYFYWGTDPTMSIYSTYYAGGVVANGMVQPFKAPLSGLATHTKYYFQTVFYNSSNGSYQYGAVMAFATLKTTTVTEAATSITSSVAILNGSVNPNSSSGSVYFYWGTDPTMSIYNIYYAGGVVASGMVQSFTAPLSGLATATTYYFETAFYNSSNGSYQYGAVLSFTTLTTATVTKAATAITSSAAILHGTVNPNSSSGSVYFYWGTDPTMSTYNIYYAGGVVANGMVQPFTAPLSGLATATTYYFQAVFYNSSNGRYQYGAVLSFTTLTTATVTKAATAITSSAGTLHGTVNPNSSSGSVYFYWGTDPTMSIYSTYYAGGVVANGMVQPFTAPLSGLATHTKYYFQTVFYNSSNGSYQYGAVLAFTTLKTTTVTEAATSITSSAAIPNGTVNPNSSSGSVYFYWGTDPTMSIYNIYYAGGVVASGMVQPFTAPLSGLATHTKYYFQTVFYNSSNGSYQYGLVLNFTTQ